jgi:hypothetical protein
MSDPHRAFHVEAPDAEARDDSLLGTIVGHPMEVVTAVSLSVAALLTSWAAYQAALWDGAESAEYSRANVQRTEAAQLATRAGQLEAMDVLTSMQWLNAYAAGDAKLQAFYRARLRPEFVPAFEAWLATDPRNNPNAPASPFVMPQYQSAAQKQADALEAQAEAGLDRGELAKHHSNEFIQVTVVLASAMFFGGIVQVFKIRRVRFALVGVSVLTCLWALVKVITLPVH